MESHFDSAHGAALNDLINPMKNPNNSKLPEGGRQATWEQDGICINDQGYLLMLHPLAENAADAEGRVADPIVWYQAFSEKYDNERAIKHLQDRLTSLQPDLFVPIVLAELEKRAQDADGLRNETPAGKAIGQQAMAYRDAIALIKRHVAIP
jgi:hypothetical protein